MLSGEATLLAITPFSSPVITRPSLSHRAYDRSVFAHGALKAARWVSGKKPGIYGMAEVLDLK